MAQRKKMTASRMILNGGVLNFRRAIRHAARFGAECRAADPPRLLTMPEYIEASGMSRAGAYKALTAWKACCGDLSVLDVVSLEALQSSGFTDDEREEVIARELASRDG